MEIIFLPCQEERKLKSYYQRALDNATELYIVSAYLTHWENDYPLSKHCKTFRLIVGKDFGITRKQACRDVMKWLPNHRRAQFLVAEYIDGFHPKANYLVHQGAIEGEVAELPQLKYPATPLAGSEQFLAPISGILVHRANIGDLIQIGQPLFDIIDPVTDEHITVHSNTEGIFYMRRDVRFARLGDPLGRVTGKTAQRSGKLLSA
ncbi:hypothetical protein C7W93_07880 [Glaciimonas sp. PCH181]|nr:hypothetical protein [Glaciimonas sp. PCH181]PUA19736.1 hypothetical protein C7W93_07880 [Glaciimonas sp. PCH181]